MPCELLAAPPPKLVSKMPNEGSLCGHGSYRAEHLISAQRALNGRESCEELSGEVGGVKHVRHPGLLESEQPLIESPQSLRVIEDCGHVHLATVLRVI